MKKKLKLTRETVRDLTVKSSVKTGSQSSSDVAMGEPSADSFAMTTIPSGVK